MAYTDPYLAFSENFVRSNLMMRQLEYAREMQRRQEERYGAQLAEVVRHNKVGEKMLADQYAAKRTTDFSAATDWTPVHEMMDRYIKTGGRAVLGKYNYPKETVLGGWQGFAGEFADTAEGQQLSPAGWRTLRQQYYNRLTELNRKTTRWTGWTPSKEGEWEIPPVGELVLPGQTAPGPSMTTPAFPATTPPAESPAAFRNPPPAKGGGFMDIFKARDPYEDRYQTGPGGIRQLKIGESKPTGQLLEKNDRQTAVAFSAAGNRKIGDILRKAGRGWRIVDFDYDGDPLVIPA